MVPLAQSIGANRIVQGKAVTTTTGDPDLPPDEERAFRRRLVERALKSLESSPEGQEVVWGEDRG